MANILAQSIQPTSDTVTLCCCSPADSPHSQSRYILITHNFFMCYLHFNLTWMISVPMNDLQSSRKFNNYALHVTQCALILQLYHWFQTYSTAWNESYQPQHLPWTSYSHNICRCYKVWRLISYGMCYCRVWQNCTKCWWNLLLPSTTTEFETKCAFKTWVNMSQKTMIYNYYESIKSHKLRNYKVFLKWVI